MSSSQKTLAKFGKHQISLSSGDTIPVSIEEQEFSSLNITAYETDRLIELINENYAGSRWRIYLLFPDETIDREIPAEDIVLGGSFSENYQDGQRRSLSFSLYNETGKYSPNINMFWGGTRLRLDRGVELYDGTVVWFQSGVFIVSQAVNSFDVSQRIVQITAKDKFSLFEDNTGTLETSYEIPEGSDIYEIVCRIMLTDMGNGNPMDPRPVLFHSSLLGKKTQVTISKSAGENYGSILLELATQLSSEIFYNAAGNLVFIPTEETSLDVSKPLMFDYNVDSGDVGSLDFSFDLTSVINRVIVIGSTVNGGVVTATAVNDNAASPLCYQRIGYHTGNIINDTNISTELLARERAQYELRKQLILKTSTNITTLYNPLLSVNNLISVTSDFFGLTHERFLVKSISCSLDYSGTMNINISNIRNLPSIL